MADYSGNHLDGLEGRDEVFFCIDVFLMTVDDYNDCKDNDSSY